MYLGTGLVSWQPQCYPRSCRDRQTGQNQLVVSTKKFRQHIAGEQSPADNHQDPDEEAPLFVSRHHGRDRRALRTKGDPCREGG